MYTVALFRLILSRRHGHLYVPDACLDSLVRVVFQVWPIHGNCEYYFFLQLSRFGMSITSVRFYDNSNEPVRKSFFFRLFKKQNFELFFCIAAFYFRAIMVLLILWYNA